MKRDPDTILTAITLAALCAALAFAILMSINAPQWP